LSAPGNSRFSTEIASCSWTGFKVSKDFFVLPEVASLNPGHRVLHLTSGNKVDFCRNGDYNRGERSPFSFPTLSFLIYSIHHTVGRVLP
jgi:hypothetical protein